MGDWRFPNRVRLAAALLPAVWKDEVPKLLDACTKFVDPALERAAFERGYRLVVCDVEPDDPRVERVDITQRLPWRDGYFAGALCEDTLEHVANPLPIFAELRRVIRAGGFLLVHLPVDRGATPTTWREKSLRTDPEANEHKHYWLPGTDFGDFAVKAGFRLVGRVEGYDDEVFRVRVMWLFARP